MTNQTEALKLAIEAMELYQVDIDRIFIDIALSATPAQSLQEHDNEVIERCAEAMENYHELEGIPAMYIRSLKVTP